MEEEQMNAIILAGGKGKKIWPYARYHNKGMLKVGNQPILQHSVESLLKNDIDEIIIVAQHHSDEISAFYRKEKRVQVMGISESLGSADTLKQVKDKIQEDTLVLYGDCVILEEDLSEFIKSQKDILISHLHQDSNLQIVIEVDDHFKLKKFWGHPRGDFKYFVAGFKVNQSIIPYLETTSIFNETKVGVGSPTEYYVENSLYEYLQDGNEMNCYLSEHQIYDVDKPWHLLEANHFYNQFQASKITKSIGTDTYISENAKVNRAIIGNHCYIGDHVVIEDGCIIEDYTKIDQGAILGVGVHIGKRCTIENYCKIGDYSSIGNECIVGHTAEIIEAVLFDKVYAYHYGEYYGVIGTHTDLGAGTTCGTLRFDDGKTEHDVCGHCEVPNLYSNACYIGDYSRTGVGAILLPGCKVGSKSIVGSGVILNEDVEDNTLIYSKQELVKKTWNDHNYGW